MPLFKTPILFLIFNRPENTLEVFNEIKRIKPAKLYISADGPRLNNKEDLKKCELTKKIFDTIDWNCEVKTNFREVNFGCKLAVSSGISWFFEHEEMGIILEDDCLPNRSFFIFCEIMLHKYQNDTRIMHIGGTNFQLYKKKLEKSYYFSKLIHVWGWATWKRAWDLYDIEMNNLEEFKNEEIIKSIFSNAKDQNYWIDTLVNVKKNKIDTWDFMWVFSVWKNNGLSIIPHRNLIKNIGFGPDATHTTKENTIFSKIHQFELPQPFIDPQLVVPDLKLDSYTNALEKRGSTIKSFLNFLKNH